MNHRFSEKQFRRFEPIIAAVLSAYPQPFTFAPVTMTLSFETFASRYRDACHSFKKNNWESKLDRDKFLLHFDEIKKVTFLDDGHVWIGPSPKKVPFPPTTLQLMTEKIKTEDPGLVNDILSQFPKALED